MLAQNMKDKNYRAWKEAKSANIWDDDQESYLDLKGNIIVEPSTLRQREWARQAEEEEKLKSKKVDDGIIDTTKEMTAEKLMKMAEKVLATKEIEVDSKSAYESKCKVSSSGSTDESGKTDKAKIESDCKNCMKNCKVCSTHAYLSAKKTKELAAKVKSV
ncbi:hypothetical protein Hanom_Chr12g01135981 [Helianthus anomalus]